MENEHKLPELTEAYLRANVPHRSKVRIAQQLLVPVMFVGMALVVAAQYKPQLFPFPPTLLDLACAGVPRCAGMVEQMLLDGLDSRALLVQQAYAIGAMGFLLCLLPMLPLVAAYYRYCLTMCRLTHRRTIQIAQYAESVSAGEQTALRANSGAFNIILFVLSIAVVLALYWEIDYGIVSSFIDYAGNTVVIAALAVGLYTMLFITLVFSIWAFAGFRSLEPSN